MRVFEFAAKKGFEWVLPMKDADFRAFRRFGGNPKRAGWLPIRMRLVTTDENGRPLSQSDMPWLGEHAPVLRERAVSALGALLNENGELLPLECPGASLVVFNATRVVNALDLERSRIARFPSSGQIMNVESFAFDDSRLSNERVFKVPELLNDAVFVTEHVVEAVRKNDLKGVGFKLVWDGAEAASKAG